VSVIENLKENAPHEPKKGQKRLRTETAHLTLIKALEDRLEAIDAELVVSGFVCIRMGGHDMLLSRTSYMWNYFTIPGIDSLTDLAVVSQRVQKVRRKIEQKRMLLAQAEIRETRTRTRARTQKPDYVYNQDFSEVSRDVLSLTLLS